MKKFFLSALVFVMMAALFTTSVAAVGDKVHGDKGVGYVNQEDPVGPGDQPDWQD